MRNFLKTRRSVRVFTPEKVREETQKHILQAGMLAPTGMGTKSIEYIVTEDETKIRELVDVKMHHSTKPLKTATLAIIVLGNSDMTDTWVEDASLAAIFMQLEVTAQGLGSTWIQVHKRRNEAGQESVEFLRERFHFPPHMKPLCVLAIGHKAEDPRHYTDDDCDFSKVSYEKYGA